MFGARSRNPDCSNSPIESIEEHGHDLERHLLANPERPAEAKLLAWAAEAPVIVVVGRRMPHSPAAGSVQAAGFSTRFVARIEAVAVQVLQEQRLTGYAIATVLRKQMLESGCSERWHGDRESALVTQDRAECPSARCERTNGFEPKRAIGS